MFTEATRPTMLDHPWRDLEMIGKEFLTRHLPRHEARIELRPGPVGTRVAEVCDEQRSGPDRVELVSGQLQAGEHTWFARSSAVRNYPSCSFPFREKVRRDSRPRVNRPTCERG